MSEEGSCQRHGFSRQTSQGARAEAEEDGHFRSLMRHLHLLRQAVMWKAFSIQACWEDDEEGVDDVMSALQSELDRIKEQKRGVAAANYNGEVVFRKELEAFVSDNSFAACEEVKSFIASFGNQVGQTPPEDIVAAVLAAEAAGHVGPVGALPPPVPEADAEMEEEEVPGAPGPPIDADAEANDFQLLEYAQAQDD